MDKKVILLKFLLAINIFTYPCLMANDVKQQVAASTRKPKVIQSPQVGDAKQQAATTRKPTQSPQAITAESKKLPKALHDPLLVVVLMVKNEDHVIVPTIDSYAKGGIKDFFIFDTGSTDKTVERAQEYFKEKKLERSYIAQEPFIDFSTSRNRALELAEEKFPNATFMLMPDAEWYMHNAEDLITFCQKEADSTAYNPCYAVRICNNWQDFCTQRLFRCANKVRFAGGVHEGPTQVGNGKVPETIYFELGSTERGRAKTSARFFRDIEILKKELEKDPNNSRSAFYAGQTESCIAHIFAAEGDLEKAIAHMEESLKYYRKRKALIGWPEENFLTSYRIGCAEEALAEFKEKIAQPQATSPDENRYNEAIKELLYAHALWPHRAEPLTKLAQIHWRLGKQALCFLYGSRALVLPYPKNDFLDIEKNVYDYERFEIISKSAYYVGEYKLGELATKKVLAQTPDEPQYYKNLAIYLELQREMNFRGKEHGPFRFEEAPIAAAA